MLYDSPIIISHLMSKHPIGKLERVALREVWKHEALNFTQWLQENIDVHGFKSEVQHYIFLGNNSEGARNSYRSRGRSLSSLAIQSHCF